MPRAGASITPMDVVTSPVSTTHIPSVSIEIPTGMPQAITCLVLFTDTLISLIGIVPNKFTVNLYSETSPEFIVSGSIRFTATGTASSSDLTVPTKGSPTSIVPSEKESIYILSGIFFLT